MTLKIIIVDDELLAREMLVHMITSLELDIEIADVCSDLPDAIKAINKTKPDLVFLDIDMPRFKGVEIDQFIPDINFEIVFTTAYQQFAIDAIKIGAADYLLKPIDIEELKICIEKSINKKVKQENDILKCNRLIVNTAQQVHIIDYKKIIYFKAEGAYTRIVSTEHEIVASKNLKYYEELLKNNYLFIRIHKSYIVNKARIKTINKIKQQVLLDNGDNISISQDKIDKLLEF